MGDSAGANLLVQVCQKAIENNIKKPKALICLSPWIITNIRNKYWHQNKNKDFLTHFSVILAIKSYLGYTDLKNRWDRCILDFNYDLFPPMLIRAGTYELILDEILAFSDKVSKSKCNVSIEFIDNMVHSFDLFYSYTDELAPEYNTIIDFINKNIDI